MTSIAIQLITIGVAIVFAIGALAWYHLNGARLVRDARRKQRAADKREFVAAYRDTVQALIVSEPFVCYYNSRVNLKVARRLPCWCGTLPKYCFIRHGEQTLKMETTLAVQWAIEFAIRRANIIGIALQALELRLWPGDEKTLQKARATKAACTIARWLYTIVQPQVCYTPSQKPGGEQRLKDD